MRRGIHISVNKLQRAGVLFIGALLIVVYMASPLAALSQDELNSAALDAPWYNLCAPSGGNTSGGGNWQKVGASVYGGNQIGGKWVPNNLAQGVAPGHKSDDTGLADHDNMPLGTGVPVGKNPGAPSQFAELDGGKALGGLADGTKIQIEYNNKLITAQKEDVGGTNPDVKGVHRAVDIWWEAAKLLGFPDGIDVVQVRIAPDQNAPATPLNGKAVDATGANAATGGGSGNGCCLNTAAAGNVALVNGSNVKKAFFYFISQGLTAAQAAGIVGNLMQESGVNPKSVQAGGPGRGIAQWSAGGRWDELLKHEKGKDPLDIATQLDFMWYEMNNVSPWKLSLSGSHSAQYPSLKDIKGDTQADAIKAGHSFGYLYERFGIAGARDKYAGDIWNQYHSQVAGFSGAQPNATCEGGGGGICAGAPPGYVQDVNKVVDIACQEWGKKVVEDAGANCDKAGNITKYAKATGYPHCWPQGSWCGMFVGYVYKTAGHPFPGGAGVGSVPQLYGYLNRIGAYRPTSSTPKPGDVVTYGQHHTGLVVGVNPPGKPKGTVVTIEGNTGPDPATDKWVHTSSSMEGIHMHVRPFPGLQSAWGDYDVLIQKQK